MKTLAPKKVEELTQYLNDHNLDAVVSKFKLETETNGLEKFGLGGEESCKITLTLTCKKKE